VANLFLETTPLAVAWKLIILFLQPFFSIFRQRQQPFQRHIQICCFDWNAASTSGPVAEL